MSAVLDKPLEPPGPLREFWLGFAANRGALIALLVFAVIAGASPTIANTRPLGLSCAGNRSGSSGVDPVSTITS